MQDHQLSALPVPRWVKVDALTPPLKQRFAACSKSSQQRVGASAAPGSTSNANGPRRRREAGNLGTLHRARRNPTYALEGQRRERLTTDLVRAGELPLASRKNRRRNRRQTLHTIRSWVGFRPLPEPLYEQSV